MIDLKGNNLPKRQRELNNKVKEATEKKVPFEAIKDKHESTDVDKLFKIDLASNYKDIDYIVDVLKSGDSLYISRALSKCLWMYHDDYSNIINPDYLHHNIFPFMSIKMKKKLLISIALHLRTENRAIAFYDYCIMKKLTNISFKFLILTSESFKLNVIKKNVDLYVNSNNERDFFKFFFGESFFLLEAYLESQKPKWLIESLLLQLRYLYSVTDIKYLELFEKYLKHDHEIKPDVLGFRISKDIMKKHKDRVLKKPLLYLTFLNHKAVVKYSKIEDAKLFAVTLLPESVSVFWLKNYHRTNKYILDIIPKQELFTFLKKIYTNAYPGEEFEMNAQFYHYRYYDIFTIEEREKWALHHIEQQQEVLGPGQDFKWYQFVNFETALEGIKKYIMITIDKQKRGEMINILVESARTQHDLLNLFQYYYERHVNETPSNKEQFMKTVILNHNVFEFDEDCWNGFNKILYSMHIYSNSGFFFMTDFRLIVIIYNIIHNIEIPELFKEILYSGFNYLYTDKLTKENSKTLYEFLMRFYVEKVKEFEGRSYKGNVRKNIRQYISSVLRVMEIFEKTKVDCPIVIMNYIKLDWDEFKNHHILKEKVEIKVLEEYDLVRLLKKDATLLRDKFPILNETMKTKYSFKLNQLFRKLKIYFSKDVAKEFISFFLSILSDTGSSNLSIYISVYGIFQLADQEFKVEFMFKYAPSEPKIDHEKIDNALLYIQEAICRFSCYSRPPVPLSNVLTYLKGDYIHYSLPIFNHNFVNLPHPLAIKFIEATLNAPLSVQKHGLRLAFKSYTAEDLKMLVLAVWKKTKNVSLRLVLYKNLFEKIRTVDLESQKELYQALIILTSEIHKDDDKEIFNLVSSYPLPDIFRGEILKTGWTVVSGFQENAANLEIQAEILYAIKSNITRMNRNFVMEEIIRPHINEMLINKNIRPSYKSRELSERVKVKWALVANYVVTAESEEAIQAAVQLVEFIMKTCVEMWDVVNDDKYTMRLFCNNFISSLKTNSNNFYQNFKNVNPIFEKVLEILVDAIPLNEMYLAIWDLQLVIIVRKVCTQLEYKESKNWENVDKENLCNEFANQLGNLLGDWVNKGQFYKIFLTDITHLVNAQIRIISSFIGDNWEMVRIKICYGLTAFNNCEAHLLALLLLPEDCPKDYHDVCKLTLQKLKELGNNEIEAMLHEKYYQKDFEIREYV